MKQLKTVYRKARRTLIGISGGLVLLVGIIAIPYPGPGWAIVFIGLAILATEFEWAQRLLKYAREKYDAWQVWLKDQKPVARIAFFALTCIVVIITLWLLNVYGYSNDIFKLGQDWLRSPLPWFY